MGTDYTVSIANMFLPTKSTLSGFMEESSSRHRHICPRQVLGIRMGLMGLRHLGMIDGEFQPRYDNNRKRLLTLVETDGCGADGIAVATDCYVGKRTLRVFDYGKMAATLVDTRTETAVRVIPHPDARQSALVFVPDARSHWHAYLEAYQIIPDEQLMIFKEVSLTQSIAEILSRPTARALCEACGEEIFNQREVIRNGRTLCRPCAGEKYYCDH